MGGFVYDSGALIAIGSRRDDVALERHRELMARRHHVIVPAPVAAQVVREPRRQARLMRALRGCQVVPFQPEHAAGVGVLLARAGTADVVDGFVALTAAAERAAVITSDAAGIRHLLDTLGVRLPVLAP